LEALEVSLVNRVALVTGPGSGLGKAMATAFAQSGADLILVDINLPSIEKTGEEVSAVGRKWVAYGADVSRKNEVEDVVKRAVEKFGRIDILVNNAGIIIRKPTLEFTENDWDLVIDVNLKGTFNFCYAVGKHMINQRYGRIINISSIMGGVALPPRASYCASKGGMNQLTKELAVEWAQYGITANSISPGWMITELTEKLYAQEELRKFLLERIPLGHFGQRSDIANLAVYLASDRAEYITGQNIYVDGGYTSL
jgi:NAD(P)-dependent dehydrogenase (short-subunit alcohol dehydrogenase family)